MPSSIAEGFERNSNKEFSRFLKIVKGSAGEIRTQLYLAKELLYIKENKAEDLINRIRLVSQKLQALIYSIESRIANKITKTNE